MLDVDAAKGRTPLLLLIELLEMRGIGVGLLLSVAAAAEGKSDDAEREQGSGEEEGEAALLAKTFATPPPPLAAESRLPEDAAACLSRA